MPPRVEGSKLKAELKKKRFMIDGYGPFRIYAIEMNDPIFGGEPSYDFIPADFNVNTVTRANLHKQIMTLPKSWAMNQGRVTPWKAEGGKRRSTRRMRRKTRRHTKKKIMRS